MSNAGVARPRVYSTHIEPICILNHTPIIRRQRQQRLNFSTTNIAIQHITTSTLALLHAATLTLAFYTLALAWESRRRQRRRR